MKEEIITFENFLSYEDLVLSCRSKEDSAMFIPNEQQGIWRVFDLCHELMTRYPERPVVLLGLDALNYKFLADVWDCWGSPYCWPVTSVIPSSSTCCWASILTGQKAIQHGLHGVVFFEPAIGCSVHALRPLLFNPNDEAKLNSTPVSLISPQDLIFQSALNMFNRHSFTVGRMAFEVDGPLHQQLFLATENWIPENYESLIKNPIQLVESITGRILKQVKAGYYFGFAHFNFDTFLHSHRYNDPSLLQALILLRHRCIKIAIETGCIFAFVSDHGMIEQKSTGQTCPISDDFIKSRSYAEPGGAGRILYFYIQEDQIDVVVQYLKNLLGGTAQILLRDDYIRIFLSRNSSEVFAQRRLGNVIVVATSPSFPSVMYDSLQEHGSVSEQEMFAILGISTLFYSRN